MRTLPKVLVKFKMNFKISLILVSVIASSLCFHTREKRFVSFDTLTAYLPTIPAFLNPFAKEEEKPSLNPFAEATEKPSLLNPFANNDDKSSLLPNPFAKDEKSSLLPNPFAKDEKSSLLPNPFSKDEKSSLNPFSRDSIYPKIPGLDLLSPKEDNCKDPLKYAVSGAVQAVLSRLMSPLMIPETLKKAQLDMAALMVDQSIEVGLTQGNIAKAVAVPIGTQLRMVPVVGDKIGNFAESLLEKTTTGFLGTICEQINCCFD